MYRFVVLLLAFASLVANAQQYPDEGSPPASLDAIPVDSVLLCLGMSQAHYECGSDPAKTGNGGWIASTTLPVHIVDGGISGWDTRAILQDPDEYWRQVDLRISEAGFSVADVTLIWGKNATRAETPTDEEVLILREHLEQIQDMAEARFPNLLYGFHSSRVYGGFCNLNPEPYAFETIFSVEAAVADETIWFRGPYLWADGSNPRADGLTWLREDFIADGCHPSESGQMKVAAMNERYFAQLPYGVSPPPPDPAPVPAASGGSGMFGLLDLGLALSLSLLGRVRQVCRRRVR